MTAGHTHAVDAVLSFACLLRCNVAACRQMQHKCQHTDRNVHPHRRVQGRALRRHSMGWECWRSSYCNTAEFAHTHVQTKRSVFGRVFTTKTQALRRVGRSSQLTAESAHSHPGLLGLPAPLLADSGMDLLTIRGRSSPAWSRGDGPPRPYTPVNVDCTCRQGCSPPCGGWCQWWFEHATCGG